MWNLNYMCSTWLVFELFEPMMKVEDEIYTWSSYGIRESKLFQKDKTTTEA